MTSSERPSPELLLKLEGCPQPNWGGENSGNALDASNALNYRIWRRNRFPRNRMQNRNRQNRFQLTVSVKLC